MIKKIVKQVERWLRQPKKVESRDGVCIEFFADHIEVGKDGKLIRISMSHVIYLNDIVFGFNYYFNAVKSSRFFHKRIVDYSKSRAHQVVGFDLMPVVFPSFAEPLESTQLYLDFAKLGPNMVAFDLGAYAGLSSIMFAEQIGKSGTVIALDPDPINFNVLVKNATNYNTMKGNRIRTGNHAVWKTSGKISFNSEGNMGSAVSDLTSTNRGEKVLVDCLSLSGIVQRYSLTRVDFIKCDIEGAEAEIFKDESFFREYRPKIIIEVHEVNGISTENACIEQLAKYGYRFTTLNQDGVIFPLLCCSPEY